MNDAERKVKKAFDDFSAAVDDIYLSEIRDEWQLALRTSLVIMSMMNIAMKEADA